MRSTGHLQPCTLPGAQPQPNTDAAVRMRGTRVAVQLLATLLTILLALLPVRPVLAGDSTRPSLENAFQIAPLTKALTFARYRARGEIRTLGVTRLEAETATGVDLGPGDPAALFADFGYEGLMARMQGEPDARSVQVAVDALTLPLVFRGSHIAAGANFPEHADEATVEHGPFLFTKQVQPTPWNAPISAGAALLDYEVEIAWVTLEDVAFGVTPEYLGLVVCNDFTDRALLLRHLNPWDIESGEGFTTGKSFPGALPVGPLLVIPRDYRAFVPGLKLALHANGELRQSATMRQAVWEIDEILQQAWARKDVRWSHKGAQVGLPVTGKGIPARTLLLGGTPSGTVFAGISVGQKLRGAMRWLLGGWNEPLTHHVIETYITDAKKERRFLQPGDQLHARGDYLGVVRTRVER